MFKTILLIVLSFFAVIGFIECILTLLETFSTSKYKEVSNITLTAHLSGTVKNVAFLLNTLLLQAERISYKNSVTHVVIQAEDVDEATYSEIYNFCLENDNITVEK